VYHWQRTEPPESAPLSEPRAWLVEPDPAILRAGLVQDAAASVGGFMLDETIAYFTTDAPPDSPWLRAWRVLDWMPFNLKRLRAYLRQHHVGAVTVKKRGSPIAPEALDPEAETERTSPARCVDAPPGKPIVPIWSIGTRNLNCVHKRL
jgi:hypothetical protein